MYAYKLGQGSIVLRVPLGDSAVTTGAGKTGLGIASAGLNISIAADNEAAPTVYTAAGTTIETIAALGTFAAPTATKCRFKEVDAANMPGLYEIQIADARFAVASAKYVVICITATGVAPTFLHIPLWDQDPYSVLGAVRKQLTESYAADGAAPTVEQCLILIQQILTEWVVSGTSILIKGLDGSTTKATLTLNSATVPTTMTRSA